MVNISKLKLTTLQNEILRLMFINAGNSMNAHEISQSLKVSQPAISKALPLLEKNALLTINKDARSKRLSVELNRNNHQILWIKRTDNLKQIYESELVQFLQDKLPQATIILFGSYSTGEDTTQSDIDLAILGTTQVILNLEKFEKILKRNINVSSYESFQKIDKHLKNNILNGIILKGTVDI